MRETYRGRMEGKTLEMKIMMKERAKKRNVSIEFTRIIACLIVIATHIAVGITQPDGGYDKSRLVIKYFLADGVPLFLLIMGYFLFKGNSFQQILKRVIKTIIIPVFLFIVFSQMFMGWIEHTKTFYECLRTHHVNWNEIFGHLIQWNAQLSSCWHLGFVFDYLKIIIWFPVLRLFCKSEKNENAIRRYIICLAAISILIDDIQQIYTLPIGNIIPFSIISPYLLWVVIGYELSISKDKLNQIDAKLRFSIGMLVFLAANILKIGIQYFILSTQSEATSLVMISSVGLFIALTSFQPKSEKVRISVNWIASKTFPIYVIHWSVFAKMDALGIRMKIFLSNKPGALGEVLYTIEYAVIVFVVALICVTIAQTMCTYVCKMMNRFLLKYRTMA